MKTSSHHIASFFFTAVLLVSIGLYVYFKERSFLLLPFATVGAFFMMREPRYLLYALMVTIPWSIEYNFSPSLGTDLPDEPLMLLAAFTALALLVHNHRDWSKKNFLHPLLLIIILQFLWATITVITSTDQLLSLKFLLAKGWYLLAFVALPLFLFRDEKLIQKVAILLTASMMVFMVYALFRHAALGFTFDSINTALEPFYRNHVNYSALLVFTVPIQIAAIQLTNSKWLRYFLIAVFIVCCVALYFSYSRGAWLAFIVAIAGYWLIRKKLLFLSFILFIVFCVAGVLWLRSNDNYLRFSNDFKRTIYHENFREHFRATYQLKDASTAERFYRWVAGVRMMKESWQTGFGPSTFFDQYKSYTQPAFKTWVSKNEERSTIHNYFLLITVEQGFTGLLLFVFLVACLFWYSQKIYWRTRDRFWKATTAAVAAILLMECAINFLSDMIETDKAGPVFYLCVAVLVVADIKTKKQTADPGIEG